MWRRERQRGKLCLPRFFFDAQRSTLYVQRSTHMRILVIEDDPTVGQYVKRGLEDAYCSVDSEIVQDAEPKDSVNV